MYLYPVFVALIMVFLRFYPSWQTWISIVATFGGILLLSSPSQGASVRLPGITALSYAFYLVIVNRSKRIKNVSDWGNLIGLAIVPTMISLLTLAVSSRYIGPTKTSILGVFEPLTAIMIGTLLFGEPLTVKMGIGVAVCVAAVLFMILRPGKQG